MTHTDDQAWSEPRTLVASAVITQPNGAKVDHAFVSKPMVYKTYEDYLASDLWRHIRGAIYRRDDGRCQICGRFGSYVHHLSYADAVMEGRDLDALVLLCRACRKQVTDDK